MVLAGNCFVTIQPYLVVIGTMWVNICNFAVLRSSSVLYVALMEEYNCTYNEATWPFTLIGGVGSLVTVLAGFLAHYLSIRLVVSGGILLNAISVALSSRAVTINQIIYLGALQGAGVGLFVSLIPVLLAQHFDRGRSTAFGFCYAGCTVSSIIFPRLIQHMVLSSTLSHVYEVLALSCSIGLFGAMLLFPISSPKSKSTAIDSTTHLTISRSIHDQSAGPSNQTTLPARSKSSRTIGAITSIWNRFKQDLLLFTDLHFQLITFLYVTYIFTYLIFLIILQAFAEERGLSKWHANALVVYFSMADLCGRLVPGLLHLLRLMSNRNTYVTSMFALGVSFVLMPAIAHDLTSFVLLVVCSGLMNGVQMTLPGVVMSEYLGKSSFFYFIKIRRRFQYLFVW